MSIARQLPRRSLQWLLAALSIAVVPHGGRVPVWVLAVLCIALGWRYRVHQGRWSFPSRIVKLLLVAMAFTAVALQFRTLTGLEPAVALLVIAGGLKVMELKNTRDYQVIIFVMYFLIACQLLFAQEIYQAVYAVFALAVITAALVARHQQESVEPHANPLRIAGRIMLQSVPLMVVLFVVFPRLAPLWSIPHNNTAAKTGPSDRMAPGDVARLSASSELAFRATFVGPVPAQRALYWRGLVFSEFDGREWSPSGWAGYETVLAARGARKLARDKPGFIASGVEAEYHIILEPSNQPWAYVLGYPLSFDDSLRIGSDYRLMTGVPVTQRIRYRVHADIAATLEPELGRLRRSVELRLPEGYNPRALDMARQWRAQTASDQAYIDRLLDWFNREAFVYTLQPPLLGRDSVDEFLFDTRRGFCEHYASAFVVLLRAAGVPARVVVGYQGGERNPFGEYLLVHQYDAHAWAEAWLAGRGWVRFDPTAAVSPERVELGLSDALGAEFLSDSPLAMQRYDGMLAVAWVRMRWDMLTYHWARLVLQYDSEAQFALLHRLLGEITPARMITALMLCGALVLLLVIWSLFGWPRRTQRDAATTAYLLMCQRLAAVGLQRRSGEGPLDFASRVAAARPDLAEEIRSITHAYVGLCFAGMTAELHRDALARMQRSVRRFHPAQPR